MVDFVSWLQDWKLYSEHNKTTCLTAETYVALRHTVNTIIYMIHDLLNNNILDYILLGKFQTDNLESRFGQYRMLSGCNYLISVPEVMQSEKKLRIKSLLKLHASQNEAKFIKVVNQKQTLIGLFEKHITNLDYFIHHLVPCEVCGCEVVTNVMRSLSCFANILLKNYSTNKSEAVSIAKISRKVSKF